MTTLMNHSNKPIFPVPYWLREIVQYLCLLWILLVGLWVYGLRSFAKHEILSSQNRVVEETIFSDLRAAEAAQRGYLLSRGDRDYYIVYINSRGNVRSAVRLLNEYTRDRADLKQPVAILSTQINDKISEMDHIVSVLEASGPEPAIKLFNTKRGYYLMVHIKDCIDVIRGKERDYIRKRSFGVF